MFSREGAARSDVQNRFLAGYLASVGGYANASGFVTVGAFTSHVTGNVARFAVEAGRDSGAAFGALALVGAFFLGAFVVGAILDRRTPGERARGYAVALAVEAVALLVFALLPGAAADTAPRWLDAQAALVCAAMGIQNGLVTHLSGAVVRTTHLTGVVTDLGMEASRWLRYAVGVGMSIGRRERPHLPKLLLLVTIIAAFVVGSLAGAVTTVSLGRHAMLVAVAGIAAASAYALGRPPVAIRAE